MADRVGVRPISSDEGNRLLRIVRRSSGSVVTWRRAQMVLLSAQGMTVTKIAEVTFTSTDRVRDVLHNFNTDGFDSLYPRYRGGRPPTFTLPQRHRIKQLALSRPQDHDLPLSTWSLAKLADFVVAEGVVDDISHEGLRVLLHQEGVSFQRLQTFKRSNDPDYDSKANRVLALYAIADGRAEPGPGLVRAWSGRPDGDHLHGRVRPAQSPTPPRSPVAVAGGGAWRPRRRRRATYKRPHGIRTCWPPTTWPPTGSMATSSHARAGWSSWRSAATCARCTRPRCGSGSCWTTSARTGRPRPTPEDARVGDWAQRSNVELAYVPFYASWLNRIEAQFQALRYFTLDGTDHASHAEQGRMIRRYIAWRNRNTQHHKLREIVNRANVA
jgi:transposase